MSVSEECLALRCIKVECGPLVSWDVCKVDGKVSDILLGWLVDNMLGVSILLSRDDNGSITLARAILLLLSRLILVGLLVHEGLKDAIGGHSHDDLLSI